MKDHELHGAGLLGGQGRDARDVHNDSRLLPRFLLVGLMLVLVMMIGACAPTSLSPRAEAGLQSFFDRGGTVVAPGNGDLIFVHPDGSAYSLRGGEQ